jgi:hypothetical protein
MQDLKLKSEHGIFVLAVTMALASGVFVSGVMNASKTLPSTGSIKTINVEVYWDYECIQNATVIDWDILEPGDMVNKTVYIKNSGSSDLILSMSSTDWIPVEAENIFLFTWDMEGATVEAYGVVQAVLMLEVSESITEDTDFSFRVVIEGSG